jgi:hypothetical protein
MTFRRAGVFWTTVLVALGGSAITVPWGAVYIRREWFDDAATRYHESIHLDQIRRDGPVVFSIKYLWWLLRWGYRNNPYELEAYALERARFGPGY